LPGTYTQLTAHVVFATKGRRPWISHEIAERLYPYLGGVLRNERCVLYDIGGIEDHVHMYIRVRPDLAMSDLMRVVKSRSSRWVHESFDSLGDFAWQEGFSAFSVSKSQEDALKRYIAGQAEHHRREDFKSELLRLLVAHGIEFEDRYVFD
jgi:REP element-mobilizing transposase RayT